MHKFSSGGMPPDRPSLAGALWNPPFQKLLRKYYAPLLPDLVSVLCTAFSPKVLLNEILPATFAQKAIILSGRSLSCHYVMAFQVGAFP